MVDQTKESAQNHGNREAETNTWTPQGSTDFGWYQQKEAAREHAEKLRREREG